METRPASVARACFLTCKSGTIFANGAYILDVCAIHVTPAFGKVASFVKYRFNIKEAVKNIKRYNERETTVASDYLLKYHFNDLDAYTNLNNISSLIILIDGLWNTQLFRENGASEAIRNSFKKNWQLIRKSLNSLDQNDLQNNPDKVIKVAKELFPIFLAGC